MKADETAFDVIVIGAGMAGASVAAELAGSARVAMLEMESRPGYHTTGRSAAVFAPCYGPAPIRALTRAADAFYRSPPEGFTEAPLLSPRGVMMIARADQLPALDAALDELGSEGEFQRLDGTEVRARHPLLRVGYAAGGYYDANCADIDVDALHQGYLRQFRLAGGQIMTDAEVTGLSRSGECWTVRTATGEFTAPVVVNAAGAWSDLVGKLAGAEAIGLVPKRRTALLVAAPEGITLADCPLVADIDEEFYMKPDAGRLLLSPANEDPDVPSDVQPDEMDIALCIDRVERAFDLKVSRIEHRWAGLRSFVADKSPVAGFSEAVDGFFWLAGQGGYGIQTAPALSKFAASQVLGEAVPQFILDKGLDPAWLSPGRLAVAA